MNFSITCDMCGEGICVWNSYDQTAKVDLGAAQCLCGCYYCSNCVADAQLDKWIAEIGAYDRCEGCTSPDGLDWERINRWILEKAGFTRASALEKLGMTLEEAATAVSLQGSG